MIAADHLAQSAYNASDSPLKLAARNSPLPVSAGGPDSNSLTFGAPLGGLAHLVPNVDAALLMPKALGLTQ